MIYCIQRLEKFSFSQKFAWNNSGRNYSPFPIYTLEVLGVYLLEMFNLGLLSIYVFFYIHVFGFVLHYVGEKYTQIA